ncbi:hypothetical protein FS837_004866 [Tulasnella sp. UAMH 9824]|nr:hypothetical protein FS837_004866 [Tulasnella sp. UAMH 9824]
MLFGLWSRKYLPEESSSSPIPALRSKWSLKVMLSGRTDGEGIDATTPKDTKEQSNTPPTTPRFAPFSLLSRFLPRRSNSGNTSTANEAAKSYRPRPVSTESQASSSLSEFNYMFFAPARPEMLGLTESLEVRAPTANTEEDTSTASPAASSQPLASLHPIVPSSPEPHEVVALAEVADTNAICTRTPASSNPSTLRKDYRQEKVWFSQEVKATGDQLSIRSGSTNSYAKARSIKVEATLGGYVSESSGGTSTDSLRVPTSRSTPTAGGPQTRHHIVSLPVKQPRAATPVSVTEKNAREAPGHLEIPTPTSSQSGASGQDTRIIQPGTVVVRTGTAVVHSTLSRPITVAEMEEELRWYAMFNCPQFYFMKVQAARARGYEVGPDHTLRPISSPASPVSSQD